MNIYKKEIMNYLYCTFNNFYMKKKKKKKKNIYKNI